MPTILFNPVAEIIPEARLLKFFFQSFSWPSGEITVFKESFRPGNRFPGFYGKIRALLEAFPNHVNHYDLSCEPCQHMKT